MNTCPNCGKMSGLHSSILQGCMCQYSIQSPPPRQPLSFEQVEDCFPEGYGTEDNGILVSAQWLHDFARAIEAAHGIKGEA